MIIYLQADCRFRFILDFGFEILEQDFRPNKWTVSKFIANP